MDPRLAAALRVAAAGSIVAASLAVAQTASLPALPPPLPDSAVPAAPQVLPPPPEIGPAVEAPPKLSKPKPTRRLADDTAPAAPLPPPAVLRSPVAVLQVLDKVTAETLRFEAPVGRRVRYKTLVVEVKACETRSYNDVQPRASAYLSVETRVAPGQAPQDSGGAELFRGWMFSTTPALHALEHPVYDLWLVACSAAAPVA